MAASLSTVPLDVTANGIWELLQTSERHRFRLASKGMAELGNQIVCSATHVLHAVVDWEKGKIPLFSWSTPTAAEQHSSRAAWLAVLQQQSNFLSRLPRLTSLTITRWSVESDLVHALQHYDPALHQRIQKLTLHGGSGEALTATGAQAICTAFPQLHELLITCATAQSLGDIIRPLRGTALTRLSVANLGGISDAAVRSIGALSLLQHLHLSGFSAHPATNLRALATLHSLRDCSLECRSGSAPPAGLSSFSSLFSLTQLTRLRLLFASSTNSVQPSAALALLGGLVQLQALELDWCVLTDHVMVQLDRLPQLLHLRVSGIALALPSCGHLSALQSLVTGSGNQPPTPSRLLQALQPLLPLPSLQHLCTTPYAAHLPLSLSINSDPGFNAAADASALLQLSSHLAAAPGLRLSALHLQHNPDYRFNPSTLCLRRIAQGLQPLSLQLSHLQLRGRQHVELEWGALGTAMAGLSRITLEGFEVSDGGLTRMVEQLPGLTRLDLLGCSLMRGSALLEDSGWPNAGRRLTNAVVRQMRGAAAVAAMRSGRPDFAVVLDGVESDIEAGLTITSA